ncbi:CXXC-type zinc finger protein 1 [Eumeta japonica]|uniref:CXXC-type zinc finger protein 1 n=1 Tax=Eumeta variegata TaxID=151549 RepID=A0A4C1X6F3_EUMVA|nr:CXXC-type zinc finger protein 1 [Eumeta japonica]
MLFNIAGRDDRKKKRKGKDYSETKSSKRSSIKDGCGECAACLRAHDCGRNRSKKKHHERESDEYVESITHLQSTMPRHCCGPQCTHTARYGSKYCSDQCGLRLATARIYQVLPQRIQEWSLSSCVAEEKNRKQLEVVRAGLTRAQAALKALDKQHTELDELVQKAKNATILPTDEKEPDDETSMYCITCGHEIHSRTAVKHMEKCFVKYEAQASFGSRHRTRIDGQSMFCDYYNPVNGTYCKRLRVMCPEHFKDPKVSDTEVCGCPLVRDVFTPTGEFCRAPKKSCLKHYQWEKLRRAEIDMERVRQWLKLDELLDQQRHIRAAMSARAGVLGLMLHSTYNHEVMERITGKVNENGKPPS